MRLAQAPGLLARLGALGSNNVPRATQSAAFAARARIQRSHPNHVVLNAASASSGRRTGCASCAVPKATFMETFRVPSPHALAPHARGTLPRTRRQQTGGGLSEWLRGEGGEAAPSASEQAQSGFAESFAAHLQACRVLLLDVSFRPIDVLTWQVRRQPFLCFAFPPLRTHLFNSVPSQCSSSTRWRCSPITILQCAAQGTPASPASPARLADCFSNTPLLSEHRTPCPLCSR